MKKLNDQALKNICGGKAIDYKPLPGNRKGGIFQALCLIGMLGAKYSFLSLLMGKRIRSSTSAYDV